MEVLDCPFTHRTLHRGLGHCRLRIFISKQGGLWSGFIGISVLWIILILMIVRGEASGAKCLNNRPEVLPKRHFYYQGSSLPLVLEVSSRSSHQLVSRILRILLSEVLGYQSVQLKYKNNSRDISSVLDRMGSRPGSRKSPLRPDDSVPETMIHTEVWVPAGYNLESALNRNGGKVITAGPLGPLSRFGWFMPTELVERVWNSSQLTIDHWRMLSIDEVTRQFAVDDATRLLLRNRLTKADPALNESFCSQMYGEAACINGTYRPAQCEGSNTCAVLFSSYPDLDDDILRQQIEGLALNVSIAWIGENLESFVRERINNKKSTLFFNWIPNDITAGSGYTRVLFPSCQSPVSSVFVDRPLGKNSRKFGKPSGRSRGAKKRDLGNGSAEVWGDVIHSSQEVGDSGSYEGIYPVSSQGYKRSWHGGLVPRTAMNLIKSRGDVFPAGFWQSETGRVYPVGDSRRDCDFVVNQLTKIIWSVMKTHTPEAHHLISALTIKQDELDSLLGRFSRRRLQLRQSVDDVPVDDSDVENLLNEIACEWVKENERLWMRWIPESFSSKTPIYLGGLFPLTGPNWRQPSIVPGAQMAVEFVNNDPDILADYELFLNLKDTQCTVDVAMSQYLQYAINTSHPIAGIIGPGCSETVEPIAGLAKHFNTIVISYSAEAFTLTDRNMFPLFFRTMPHIVQNGAVFVSLMKKFGWERIALLAEDEHNFPDYSTFLKDKFLSNSIQVIYDRKLPKMLNMSIAAKYVEELKALDVKLIMLSSFEKGARSFICEAYNQGLTTANGYVWFLPAWFTKQWDRTDLFDRYIHEQVTCTPEEISSTVDGYFMLNTASFAHDETRIVGNLTVNQWKLSYDQRLRELHLGEHSPYASYAYDAVMVFALGLDKLLREDPSSLESLHTDETTMKLMRILDNTDISGVAGPIRFDGAERNGIINVNQYISAASHSRLVGKPVEAMLNPIGEFMVDKSNASDRLMLNSSLVVWFTPDGRVPSDGRPVPKVCSIERFRSLLGVDCDTAIIIANIIGISIFFVLMLVGLLLVKKRYDTKVKRIRDILGLPEDTDFMGLDKWQIPRDHVVINRKVGEGAFGTVYGGEALIDSVWVAVAVKALKGGAPSETKLDFLSEAEMMKRFDHINIVKLLGVCTRVEPVYAVMEFMLHGNLKHFLLARRSMVGQTTKEAEDVSPQSLTQMALDIASGLEYLTECKFLHRDLACRNCLVHADKTVKIGDFGLARHIYDSNYYQYSKRGLFPVRWMAPESLTTGLFTVSSDVWSFGIVLYEIITFGSLPYPTLTNKGALEFIKAGNRMPLPPACHNDLSEMIYSCWRYSYSQRPPISSLRQSLEDSVHSNNPLVIPCLESPQNGSQMNNTSNEVLEINLHHNVASISSSVSFGHHSNMRVKTRGRQCSTTSACEPGVLAPHSLFQRTLSVTSQDGARDNTTACVVPENPGESSPGAEFVVIEPFAECGTIPHRTPVHTVVSVDGKQQNPVVSVPRRSLGTIAWQRTKSIARLGLPLFESFFQKEKTGSVSAGLQTVSPSDMKVSPCQSSSESCPVGGFIGKTSSSSSEDYGVGAALLPARCYEMTTRRSSASLGRGEGEEGGGGGGLERLLATSPVQEVDEDDVDDARIMRMYVDTTTSTTDGYHLLPINDTNTVNLHQETDNVFLHSDVHPTTECVINHSDVHFTPDCVPNNSYIHHNSDCVQNHSDTHVINTHNRTVCKMPDGSHCSHIQCDSSNSSHGKPLILPAKSKTHLVNGFMPHNSEHSFDFECHSQNSKV